MSTLILRPNCNSGYQKGLENLRAYEPPLFALLLCNRYHTDLLVDADIDNLSENETVEKVCSYNPDKVIILSSGNHPSAFIQQKDISLKLDLLLTKRGLKVETYSHLPIDPCKWTPPRWGLIDLNRYEAHNWHCFQEKSRSPYGVIFTSIGCPFSCHFCCIKSYYGTTFQQRLVEDVVKDFGDLAKLGVKNIKIMDELFIFNPNRVNTICDNIITNGWNFNIWAYARIDIMNETLIKKLKRAGVNWLCYGIESGNENIRKEEIKGIFTNDKIREVIKMTKDNGINCLGNYMFGFWSDTKETMQETLDFAIELNCEFVNMYALTPYPGSQLYEDMKKRGVQLPTSFSEYAQLSERFLPIPTKTVSARDVLKFRDKAFLDYFTNPSYLNMIKEKFGEKTLNEIKGMTSIKLQRNYGG
jgi:radical SAM superfamily enzyme YgiQ (UPF0313 family)